MYIAPQDRGEEEIFEDLMDLIDPDDEFATDILVLAGRILSVNIGHGRVRDEDEYEYALLKSLSMASGEWSIA